MICDEVDEGMFVFKICPPILVVTICHGYFDIFTKEIFPWSCGKTIDH